MAIGKFIEEKRLTEDEVRENMGECFIDDFCLG